MTTDKSEDFQDTWGIYPSWYSSTNDDRFPG
jgi:hypothetical protein